MKWYLHPHADEFPSWNPIRIGKHLPSVSLPTAEPAGRLSGDGWDLYPLTDDGPTVPEGQAVDTRTISRGDTAATAVYTYRAMTAEEVAAQRADRVEAVGAERARRLALGFDYDFQDARGVHRIGTTERDMDGWNEVTRLKDALLAAGDTTSLINIVTETGPTTVTAPEWNTILLYAASQFRQPLWQASFDLQAMNPIPADYMSDAYWPAN